MIAQMKIAILSDSHGDQRMVAAALRRLRGEKLEAILHCGDVGDAATVSCFAGLTTHFVVGNCDYDEGSLRDMAQRLDLHWHGAFADLELGGKRFALLHGDDHRRLEKAIHSGTYDYVCHGHTHARREERVGRTLVINPGALHRARPKTLALLDLATGSLESIVVAD
jgi:hypothetical protein